MSLPNKFTSTLIMLIVILSGCGGSKELRRTLQGVVDYGFPERNATKIWLYKNLRNEKIEVKVKGLGITGRYYREYDGINLDFYQNKKNIRHIVLARHIASRELEKDRPEVKYWVVLLLDKWNVVHEPFDYDDRWRFFRDIDFFSTTGGGNFLLYLPLKVPCRYIQKTEVYFNSVKSKIGKTRKLKVGEKTIVVMKIETYSNGEKYSSDWWSPELGLVAFDTPTSGVFYLESIDDRTAQKVFR